MIDLSIFKHQKFAIFGLGKSGLSVAAALKNAGADVFLWDDNKELCLIAKNNGYKITNLYDVNFSIFSNLILSPGIPFTHPKPHLIVNKANIFNTPIIGDIELFIQAIKIVNGVKLIVVTGTNGKSTTVSLVYHILKNFNLDVHLGGNIGLIPVLDMPKALVNRIYIIELSSYQIDLTPSLKKIGFAPNVSALINISADHIDRHGSIENYAKIKSRIFESQQNNDLAIYGVDNMFSVNFFKKSKTKKPIRVSSINKSVNYYCKKSKIFNNNRLLIDLCNIKSLQGIHNTQNTAIAFEIARYFKINDKIIIKEILNFPGLTHRMEYFGKIKHKNGNILFINDSKATNAEATKYALKYYSNIYWIAGGIAKNNGIKSLKQNLYQVKKAYFFGQSSQYFAQDVFGIINFEIFLTMKDAVNKAVSEIMKIKFYKKKIILLSPAASSFDQFDSFEQRGNIFKSIAFKLGARLI